MLLHKKTMSWLTFKQRSICGDITEAGASIWVHEKTLPRLVRQLYTNSRQLGQSATASSNPTTTLNASPKYTSRSGVTHSRTTSLICVRLVTCLRHTSVDEPGCTA